MDTKILEYVIAIAEEKASAKQPSVSIFPSQHSASRLKKLEDELGTPLIFAGKKWTFHHRCRENLYQWGTFYPADQAGSLKKDFLHESQ